MTTPNKSPIQNMSNIFSYKWNSWVFLHAPSRIVGAPNNKLEVAKMPFSKNLKAEASPSRPYSRCDFLLGFLLVVAPPFTAVWVHCRCRARRCHHRCANRRHHNHCKWFPSFLCYLWGWVNCLVGLRDPYNSYR